MTQVDPAELGGGAELRIIRTLDDALASVYTYLDDNEITDPAQRQSYVDTALLTGDYDDLPGGFEAAEAAVRRLHSRAETPGDGEGEFDPTMLVDAQDRVIPLDVAFYTKPSEAVVRSIRWAAGIVRDDAERTVTYTVGREVFAPEDLYGGRSLAQLVLHEMHQARPVNPVEDASAAAAKRLEAKAVHPDVSIVLVEDSPHGSRFEVRLGQGIQSQEATTTAGVVVQAGEGHVPYAVQKGATNQVPHDPVNEARFADA